MRVRCASVRVCDVVDRGTCKSTDGVERVCVVVGTVAYKERVCVVVGTVACECTERVGEGATVGVTVDEGVQETIDVASNVEEVVTSVTVDEVRAVSGVLVVTGTVVGCVVCVPAARTCRRSPSRND